MATNLRLRPDAEAALRAEAERSGRSQQDVIREAIDRHLGLGSTATRGRDIDALVTTGSIRPPRSPYRRPAERLSAPPGLDSNMLLDRRDRF